MHDDVVRTDVLGMAGQVEDHIEVRIRTRHDRVAVIACCFHGELEGAFAFIEAHREELALFAGDEEPFDPKVLSPVSNVLAEAVFVDAEVLCEGHERCRPDAVHVFLCVCLGVTARIFHDLS